MRVIVVASQKGGAGKTTLTSHLAVQADAAGSGPVAIVDMDPQAGLASWWNVREAESPALLTPPAGQLGAALDQLRAAGVVRLVLIDTPPAIGEAIAGTVAHADLVLIPARPSPNDLRAIPATVRLVEAAHKPLVFVINGVKPRVALTGQAAVMLSAHGTVALPHVLDRTLYAGAMTDGRTAPEVEPAGPAAAEMAGLWAYIAGKLEGRTTDVENRAA